MSWHTFKEFMGAVVIGCFGVTILALMAVAEVVLALSVPLFLVARFTRWLTTGPTHRLFETIEEKWLDFGGGLHEMWGEFFEELGRDLSKLKRRASNAASRRGWICI